MAVGLFQGAQENNDIPADVFRQGGEGGHAVGGIAIGNLPEQGAIALALHLGPTEVGRAAVLAAAVLFMAPGTGAYEELAANSGGSRLQTFRIGLGRSLGRRLPPI